MKPDHQQKRTCVGNCLSEMRKMAKVQKMGYGIKTTKMVFDRDLHLVRSAKGSRWLWCCLIRLPFINAIIPLSALQAQFTLYAFRLRRWRCGPTAVLSHSINSRDYSSSMRSFPCQCFSPNLTSLPMLGWWFWQKAVLPNLIKVLWWYHLSHNVPSSLKQGRWCGPSCAASSD